MAFFWCNASILTALDNLVDSIDLGSGDANGDIKLYGGSVPADADAALGGATLLGTLELSNPAFGSATDANPGGTASGASFPKSDSSIDATATCTFFRVFNKSNTCVAQGTCGTSGANINWNSVAFQSGATATISSLTATLPES